MPENRDSDFKWDEFVEYHDKELADNLGNFINRVVVLTQKYFDGHCPSGAYVPAPQQLEIQGLLDRGH
jgi:methionyl-tRNA synthetase